MAKWEESRESERGRLLLEEAEIKQKGGLWIKGKDRKIASLPKMLFSFLFLLSLLFFWKGKLGM